MNPDTPQNPRELLEMRVTALLLGELTPEEATALREVIAKDAELAALHERLKHTIELIRETAASPAEETAEQPAPARMSEGRREKLLAQFKTIAPKEFAKPPAFKLKWLIPMSAAAAVMLLLSAMLLPALSRAKAKSQKFRGNFAPSSSLAATEADKESITSTVTPLPAVVPTQPTPPANYYLDVNRNGNFDVAAQRAPRANIVLPTTTDSSESAGEKTAMPALGTDTKLAFNAEGRGRQSGDGQNNRFYTGTTSDDVGGLRNLYRQAGDATSLAEQQPVQRRIDGNVNQADSFEPRSKTSGQILGGNAQAAGGQLDFHGTTVPSYEFKGAVNEDINRSTSHSPQDKLTAEAKKIEASDKPADSWGLGFGNGATTQNGNLGLNGGNSFALAEANKRDAADKLGELGRIGGGTGGFGGGGGGNFGGGIAGIGGAGRAVNGSTDAEASSRAIANQNRGVQTDFGDGAQTDGVFRFKATDPNQVAQSHGGQLAQDSRLSERTPTKGADWTGTVTETVRAFYDDSLSATKQQQQQQITKSGAPDWVGTLDNPAQPKVSGQSFVARNDWYTDASSPAKQPLGTPPRATPSANFSGNVMNANAPVLRGSENRFELSQAPGAPGAIAPASGTATNPVLAHRWSFSEPTAGVNAPLSRAPISMNSATVVNNRQIDTGVEGTYAQSQKETARPDTVNPTGLFPGTFFPTSPSGIPGANTLIAPSLAGGNGRQGQQQVIAGTYFGGINAQSKNNVDSLSALTTQAGAKPVEAEHEKAGKDLALLGDSDSDPRLQGNALYLGLQATNSITVGAVEAGRPVAGQGPAVLPTKNVNLADATELMTDLFDNGQRPGQNQKRESETVARGGSVSREAAVSPKTFSGSSNLPTITLKGVSIRGEAKVAQEEAQVSARTATVEEMFGTTKVPKVAREYFADSEKKPEAAKEEAKQLAAANGRSVDELEVLRQRDDVLRRQSNVIDSGRESSGPGSKLGPMTAFQLNGAKAQAELDKKPEEKDTFGLIARNDGRFDVEANTLGIPTVVDGNTSSTIPKHLITVSSAAEAARIKELTASGYLGTGNSVGDLLAKAKSDAAIVNQPVDTLGRVGTAELVQNGRFYLEMGDLDNAEASLKQVLTKEPSNVAALRYLELAQERRVANADPRSQLAARKALVQVESEWDLEQRSRITTSRSNAYARRGGAATGKGREEIISKLKSIQVDSAKFQGVPLREVLNTLADQARNRDPQGMGINFFVDPRALTQPGALDANGVPLPSGADIDRIADSKVQLDLANGRLEDVLDAIVKNSNPLLKYEIRDSAVMFSLKDGNSATANQQVQAKPATTVQTDPVVPKPASPPPVPQPEVQVRENAFSTFSLNVSDVSFKLAGASLDKGTLPEPGAVRAEEFINAFDYRDPEPGPGVPIAFASERAHDPFAQNRDFLRFSVKTGAAGRQADRPLNIVLLLDNSGSMERADRVQIIHEALRVLASQLKPQDRVSVITFSRLARLWVDGIAGNQAGDVLDHVGSLTPEGGTNLEEAMKLAYATALRHYLANGMNRVVMLTDGAANLGNVNPASLKQMVETQRQQGVALDCFGVGWEGFNDDLLEELSRNGDGRYGFINSPEEAATEFAGQLAGALQVAASDVKVQVEFNAKRVSSYRQVGYAKHQLTKEQFRDNTVDAAEIAAAEAGNALYTVETNPSGEGPVATVRVRYRDPGTRSYYEKEWVVPYNGPAAALDQGSAAMRLAAASASFAEWLAQSPFASEVSPDRLLRILSGVPEVYGADARPKKLETMIREAKSLTGQ